LTPTAAANIENEIESEEISVGVTRTKYPVPEISCTRVAMKFPE